MCLALGHRLIIQGKGRSVVVCPVCLYLSASTPSTCMIVFAHAGDGLEQAQTKPRRGPSKEREGRKRRGGSRPTNHSLQMILLPASPPFQSSLLRGASTPRRARHLAAAHSSSPPCHRESTSQGNRARPRASRLRCGRASSARAASQTTAPPPSPGSCRRLRRTERSSRCPRRTAEVYCARTRRAR